MVTECLVAWTSPLRTLDWQLQALTNVDAMDKLISYRSGEPWVRIGIDGVTFWHSHVVATTVSVCGKPKKYKEHTPQRHSVIALYCGYDSQETLKTIVEHIKLDEALRKLNGKQMTVQGQQSKVRIFMEGDHMLQYKICGRDGPTSTNEDRYACPYCSATAPNVLAYHRLVPRLAKSPNSLLPSVPVEHHPPDCAHGVVNVLYSLLSDMQLLGSPFRLAPPRQAVQQMQCNRSRDGRKLSNNTTNA